MSLESFVQEMFGDIPLRQRGKMLAGEFSGAVVSANALIIATVLAQRNGALRLDHDKCRTLVLESEEQVDIQCFDYQLRGLFREFSISRLTLRLAPPRSRYGGTLTGGIIRTILQLIDDVEVSVIHTSTVSTWLYREKPAVPDWPHRKKTVAGAQCRAVEAAAYAAALDRNSRSLAGEQP
jgi:hypothetical protein